MAELTLTEVNIEDFDEDKTTVEEEEEENFEDHDRHELIYGIEEVPSWPQCIFLGLQHYLTMAGATITVPVLLTPLLCISGDNPVKGVFFSTIIFVSGFITLLQTTVGVRLPIVQGGSFSFLIPTLIILANSFPSCEEELTKDLTPDGVEQLYLVRIREIQGSICVASLVQILLGFTGIIGIGLKYITPLTIVPTITLIGLAFFDVAAEKAATHWGISILTMVLLIVFSQFMENVELPVPRVTMKGISTTKSKIFSLFPVLFTIAISWGLCGILTAFNVLDENSPARTDMKEDLIRDSHWFYVPYPFQFGLPTVSVASALGMSSGVLASVVESIGDYYACARLCDAPVPPTHAINRGIFMEGIGCTLAGIWGTGNGTTSYSDNIGVIRVTRVGSRRVVQTAALLMIFFSCFGKFGAFFVTIPDPIIGGMFIVMSSIVTAVGLSNLQSVDLNSPRNLFVLGFSLFSGLALPKWVSQNSHVISTGYFALNQIITVLASSPMFVGGMLGFVLDNTVPGTRKERGLDQWNTSASTKDEHDRLRIKETYDLPVGMNCIGSIPRLSRLPVCPGYEG